MSLDIKGKKFLSPKPAFEKPWPIVQGFYHIPQHKGSITGRSKCISELQVIQWLRFNRGISNYIGFVTTTKPKLNGLGVKKYNVTKDPRIFSTTRNKSYNNIS